jgi:perosamine synthetase
MSAVRAIGAAPSRQEIERQLAEYLRLRQVFLLSSGKSALSLLLQALQSLQPGRSVAIPAYTCFSVPAAVIKAGLRPVLIDVDPDTFDFAADSLARAFDTADLLAVVPTHLFGIPADLTRVRTRRGAGPVFIIEDAAQALGVQSAGERLGRGGDAAIFSLGRGKHLSAGGGGFIATDNEQIARRVTALVDLLPEPTMMTSLRHAAEMAAVEALIDPRWYWLPAGLPFLGLGETEYSTDFSVARIDRVSVGALHGWQRRLERANHDRQRTCRAYMKELGIDFVAGRDHPLLRFPLVLGGTAQRAAVLAASVERGLGASRMYPTAIHRIPGLQGQFGGAGFPGAEAIAAGLVTLPTHQFVTSADRRELASLLRESAPRPLTGSASTNAVPSW